MAAFRPIWWVVQEGFLFGCWRRGRRENTASCHLGTIGSANAACGGTMYTFQVLEESEGVAGRRGVTAERY